MTAKPIKYYHFDCGNSFEGPVGFCGGVYAKSPERALELLREAMLDDADICDDSLSKTKRGEGVDYIRAYFNPDAVTTADIDTIDDEAVEEAA
jgi:hypothetical protein